MVGLVGGVSRNPALRIRRRDRSAAPWARETNTQSQRAGGIGDGREGGRKKNVECIGAGSWELGAGACSANVPGKAKKGKGWKGGKVHRALEPRKRNVKRQEYIVRVRPSDMGRRGMTTKAMGLLVTPAVSVST